MNVCPEDSKMTVGETVLRGEVRARTKTSRVKNLGYHTWKDAWPASLRFSEWENREVGQTVGSSYYKPLDPSPLKGS